MNDKQNMFDSLIKEDSRPRRGGWAPGNYLNKCNCCGEEYIGDKRAIECADCAYTESKRELSNDELAKAIDRANSLAGDSDVIQKLWKEHLAELMQIQLNRAKK